MMPMLNGMDIVISDHLERPLIGHTVTPVRAHPLIAWLLRWLTGTDHVMWLREPMYGMPDALAIGNKIIMPSEMYARMREEIVRITPIPNETLGRANRERQPGTFRFARTYTQGGA